jgi:hypothetical protein
VRVAYVGNFSQPHCTEVHVAQALETNGHEVVRIQEHASRWAEVPGDAQAASPDFVLWTTTHDLAPPPTYPEQRQFLAGCGVPVVGYHLDLWWGLRRSDQIGRRPFFEVDLLCTADGGHDADWAAAGVNHVWFPPAVSEAECAPGQPRDEFAADVAFVGSWNGYHPESTHRRDLVKFLRTVGCRFWPEPGKHAVRSEALRDLYASVKVVVGDSCNVPWNPCYWSDRIPETLGRGGFLLHPHVDGLQFVDGDHLVTWQANDWQELNQKIGRYLADPDERAHIAAQGRRHVLEHHTYEVRMRQLVDLLRARSMV